MQQTISTSHFAGGLNIASAVDVPLGWSILDIAKTFHGSLDGVTAWVRASETSLDEWVEVPRHLWGRIRPKLSGVVRFGFRLQGSVGRQVVAVVATVVAAVVAPVLAPVLFPTVSAALGTAIITTAITVGAALAANALFPPDTGVAAGASSSVSGFAAAAGGASRRDRSSSFKNVESDSNLLATEGYLPLVIGKRRVSPPELAQPRPSLINGLQSIERIFGMEGGHKLSQIQVDGSEITDLEGITTQTIEGFETDPTETFVKKISNVQSVSETLSGFSLDETNLVDQDEPSNSEPRYVRTSLISDEKMEEINLRFRIDGLYKSDAANVKIRTPIRIRFRPKGSTGDWINLPEIHLIGDAAQTILQEIRFRWDNDFGSSSSIGDISYGFFYSVPAATTGALSDGSTGVQWQADAMFTSDNISAGKDGVRITLDPDQVEKVDYEFEVVRGASFENSAFNSAAYSFNSVVYSLFLAYYSGAWRVREGQGTYPGRVTFEFASVIVDRTPCQKPATCLLALQSVGQVVRNITALSERYVYDWDGEGWNTLTTTENPATQYRQILHDYLSHHGISTDLIDNDTIVAWRQECEVRGYKVSDVFSGESFAQVLARIAIAGFARVNFSDLYSVDYFRDRSAEKPVQTFSPRNSNISIEWSSEGKPYGIRAKFQNADKEYRDDEIEVTNTFYTSLQGYDVQEYSSIADPALVERRAYFDILQKQFQTRRVYLIDTAIEGMICTRGDLIGVVTDLIDDSASGMRITKVHSDTTFEIDQIIPAESTSGLFESQGLFSEESLFNEGLQSIALVSTPTGTQEKAVAGLGEQTVRLAEAISIDDAQDLLGAHIVIGPRQRLVRRCIVGEVLQKNNESATLVCVDEAPEIYEQMAARYYQ